MLKKLFSTRTIAEIGILAALGYVLDFLAGTYSAGLFPNGGSIGIAMVCVILVGFRHGSIGGIICGLIIGLLDMADGFYSIASTWNAVLAQVLLDYVVAYPLCGFGAGLFKYLIQKYTTKKKLVIYLSIGCLVGGLLKLLAHFLSGYIFWNTGVASGWESLLGHPGLYSLLYNLAYVGPSTLLSMLIIDVMCYIQPRIVIIDNYKNSNSNETKTENKQVNIYSIVSSIIGIGIIIPFLILFIQSITKEDYGEYGQDISASMEYLIYVVIGVLIILISIIWFVNSRKKEIKNFKYISYIVFIFGLLTCIYYLGTFIESSLENTINLALSMKFCCSLVILSIGSISSFTDLFEAK